MNLEELHAFHQFSKQVAKLEERVNLLIAENQKLKEENLVLKMDLDDESKRS